MRLTWTVLVVWVMAAVMTEGASRHQRQVFRCGPEETCSLLSTCSVFQELLVKRDPGILRRIRQSVCNHDRNNFKVCCPSSGDTTSTPPDSTTLTSTSRPGHGESLLPSHCAATRSRATLSDVPNFPIGFVFHGLDAKVGELPWMAVLGYDSTTNPFWGCGGTLISDQYVLTAAHCVHLTYTLGATLSVVRLGELNLKTVTDCDDGESTTCASSPPQDYTPAEVILHPDFDTRAIVSDDIALIRLDRKATLNNYVRPLCLPPVGVDVEALLGGKNVLVSGWGLIETLQKPDVLQKAYLPFVNQATCNRTFDNKLLPEQICFGGGIQDSCRGDSGGPVTHQVNSVALQLGIVSRGKDVRCGVKNVPTLYTNVAAYRNWITQHLRP